MTNNLRQISKDLRAFAKRTKDFKYTDSALIIFLMTGMISITTNLFPAATTAKSIETQRQEISSSIKGLHQKVKETRRENEKLLKDTNLELVKLMEQGDHVVKSPWSSWQFGMNYFNNNWNGTYKGRGDKKTKYPYEGVFQRSSNSFDRYTSPLSKHYGELPLGANRRSASSNERKNLPLSSYGLASNDPAQEPIVEMNVEASIRPKTVNIDIPDLGIRAPQLNALGVPNLLPPSLDIPTPSAITIPNKAPTISVQPTAEFAFNGHSVTDTSTTSSGSGRGYQDGKNQVYWSGYNPTTHSPDNSNSAYFYGTGTTPIEVNYRVPNVFYMNTHIRTPNSRWTLKDVKEVHVQGDKSKSPIGISAIHTVWDGSISNVHGFLHGYSTFIASETWHNGKVNIASSSVNIEGGYNSVFFLFPSAYYSLGMNNNDYHAHNQRGEYSGSLDVTTNGNGNNYVYSMLGVQGSFKVESSGTYDLTGNGNIVYLGLGYTPNWQNFKGQGGVPANAPQMTPLINLGTSGSIKINGNQNVGLYFGDHYNVANAGQAQNLPYDGYNDNDPHNTDYTKHVSNWKKSTVGIYQGEVSIKGTTIGGDSASDGNVGIYAASGQRTGINPETDLGAPNATERTTSTSYSHPNYTVDPIHNLQIANAEITFGKYSTNGVLLAATNGTYVEFAKPSSATEVALGTKLTDNPAGGVTASADATTNTAATGTVIAYAKGKWSDSPENIKSMTNAATSLGNAKSQIDIYVPVEMNGGAGTKGDNRSVALLADGGIISAKDTVTAKGFGSIAALAQNGGQVTVDKAIEAKDAGAGTDAATKPYLYTNIGAYAGSGGTITIAGNADIHGIGGMADGSSSVVNLNGTGNTIKTGKAGALVATKGGTVNFAGGIIDHSENEAKDHDTSTPMYADNTGHVNFTGHTTINIANGILMPGEASDYTAASGTATKYNGMQHVDVNLTGDGVVLSSHDGHAPVHWTGGTIANVIQSEMKLNSFNDGGHSYKIYYINGDFFIDGNIDLDSTTEAFNKFGLAREKVTISPGVTVSSVAGKGLALGSNKHATTNMDSGYTNKGTINITGGSATGSTGLNTSYGFVDNQGVISMDNGIGAYGVNGSKFTNNSTGTINITNGGVGMAAFASASTGRLLYGTDSKITAGSLSPADKVLELDNKGTITVAGNQSIGLYGETNELPGGLSSLSASNGSITNTGKITMTGDAAVGILAKRATVNLGGTGSSDITVGTNGIGVYAENSPVNIVSNTGIEVKDKGVGIFVKNDGSTLTGSALEIKYTGSANNSAAGIFYEGGAGHNVTNTTDVNIVNSGSNKGIVGVYMNNGGTLTNAATITDKSGKAYGIYSEGADVVNNGTLNIGNKGKGILSTGGNVRLTSSSVINLGEDEAIGVYTKGTGNNVTADAGSTMAIGNGSYGFINEGTGNTITSNMTSQTVGDNTVFVFSRDTSGTVINNTPLTSTGSLNYGLYSAGNVVNNADINYSSGIGNVGIYSINGGNAVNNPGVSITVGASNPDPTANQYAIGMAAGYIGDATTPAYTGNIENKGTINVAGPYSIGMYGVNKGTKVVNSGTINLNTNNTTGMYLDNGAEGINNGTIKSNGAGLKKVVGVVVKNGSTIENNGTIDIDADEAVGLLSKGNAAGNNPGIIKNYGTLNIRGAGAVNTQLPQPGQEISKDMGGIKIHAPSGSSTATITVNGVPVVPELATTTAEKYKPMEVSTIGMYIDTSNKRFTTPIVGLSSLSTLKNADLIIGTEAAQNTTSKYIQISPQILSPYNKMILNNPQINKWNIYSGSLTWMASVAQNQTDGTIQNAYLAKIPYTKWAGRKDSPVNSTDTYNFLDGLEQRYGVEGLGTREKLLFDKISGIGNNEEILFYQATDEMMGHQYGNLQQRINVTGNILDKEFRYLKHDWRNPSKQNNKIKIFGARDEYNTDTAGIIDYTSNAYGVAYVHEDEKIKMGNSQGWYAGAVTNRFKFKDNGHSREEQTQIKAGIFKTMSPKKDYNGSLQWTIGGDIFAGVNNMKRKYLVVDDIFQAKSNYHSYGAALKTDLGYDIRMSERTHLRPYGALKMEYGRFNKIKEDSGEMRLEVKGNDYFSVKPEVGLEFKYVQPLAVRTNLSVGLTAAYENELGKVGNVNNEGRVRYTNADWFGIRGEKEDRRGNGKFDLNIGVDNTRFGVTVNGGYDTKGNNVRGGIGFRAIY
ncbi:autotransporter-associated N-terminal domain-containing protein [Leptotrichia wadei]|uniref:Autotransporter domain-containing protein n=1 Tax=Leptotrichia wadei TaxID=157687 RepID=A0A510KCF7_9FUSO|nr:autotransporter-associated N-terminal domain-containing protein [Leptotrichia wadei]BBM49369.1 hypothetical protein JMUB3934_0664 [Leptotrichia wadei]